MRDITENPEWEKLYQYEIPVLAKVLPDGSEVGVSSLIFYFYVHALPGYVFLCLIRLHNLMWCECWSLVKIGIWNVEWNGNENGKGKEMEMISGMIHSWLAVLIEWYDDLLYFLVHPIIMANLTCLIHPILPT